MNKIIIFEWTYTPADYFEAPIHIKQDTYEMTIKDGKVEARLKHTNCEESQIRQELHKSLNSRFLGVQILTHKPFELSNISTYHMHPDGSKDVFIHVNPATITLTAMPVDIIVRDQLGNITRDTRQERIDKKKELASLAEKFGRNPIVIALLSSYNNAVNDPQNELVHLYEIRDTLNSIFTGKQKAYTTLNINKKREWVRLGKLACTEPLKQGRHRGQNAGGLRDATNAELEEARKIARRMIHAYLLHLDEANSRKENDIS
ncbi:hypothetical protein MNBD_CHLOROFLEXI01-2809 [hydrothermal vent metagenome]|uniref:Uncharacterized protein n=1 Tax=hydrothermal vent metagenome TaxID=652676 RepID=A0A3B0VG72_9ZZZZ